jgi:hypothetical protein
MSLPEMKSTLTLRQRSVWEAADSGILLWRENLLYLIRFFFPPVLAVAFGLRFIPGNLRWLSWLLLWWLKPFFDRFALQIVSARFFSTGDERGFRSIGKGFFGNLFRGLLGDLLWRRFSPLRSAVMPLRILERPKQKQYQARKNMLRQGGLNFCALLGIIGLFAEAFLLGGELIFSLAMADIFIPGLAYSLFNYPAQVEIFVYGAFCFNYMLVESLYVCMGFGLYINCRVEVEGWDLELLFKKFTGRHSVIVPLILCGVFLFTANPLKAEDTENSFPVDGYGVENEKNEKTEPEPRDYFPGGIMSDDSVPYGGLEKILESEDFGGVKEGWTIQAKNKNEREPAPDFQVDFASWVERLKRLFAYILRALIVMAIGAVIITAFIVFYRNRSRFARKGGGGVYQNPLVSEDDPEALLEKAARWFAQGSVREAWAACLTGTITALSRYRDYSFPPDATEYGCLNVVRSRSAGDAEGFSGTVRNWVLLAYGGRLPPEGSFEEALRFGKSIREKEAPCE